MFQKTHENQRKILKFPAVRPCESISSSTLLKSLINLSQKITNYHQNSFHIHRKITRESIRKINILLIFFKEIQDSGTTFTKSLTLCFSELHFILQKFNFLLEDHLREGSRVFLLMKSQFIVSQFRVLIKLIGSALEIVNLETIDICDEVKEIVELLARQCFSTRVEIDTCDQCAMEKIRLMIKLFENEFEPEKGSIKWVLDYLNIKRWDDCNKEVKFLEDQMINNDDERESVLLSSLFGLLCYIRGVYFDTLETRLTDFLRVCSSIEMINCVNFDDFRCPISLEMMVDPVTVSTGQTYDRNSIQKWLKAGNLLCPKTGKKLLSAELVPNSALRSIIHMFCCEHGISIKKSTQTNHELSKVMISPSKASREAVRFLAQFLAGRLSYGTDEQKNKAAYEIRLLAKSNLVNRLILIEVGNVAPLLDLLTSDDSETQENAIAALLKLSKHSKGQKSIIEEGGLMLLISVLRRGLKMESRQIAAATVFYLSSVDKYRRLIGSTREAIPSLIELIKQGTMCGKKNSLAAIFGLLLYYGNHERALEAGIVPVLVDLISLNERSDILEDSLAVLASLADNIDGSIAILQTSALSLIIGVLKSSSIARTGIEYCVSILHSLCINGGNEVIASLAKEQALMPALYSLVTDGSSHGSKKSRMLITMLQKFYESSSSNFAAVSAIRKERILRPI